MLNVRGLPIKITKSDLDELFKDYKVKKCVQLKDRSVVFVQLDNEEEEKRARKKLDKTQWRGQYFLLLDFIRGDDFPCGQVRSGDTGSKHQDCIEVPND